MIDKGNSSKERERKSERREANSEIVVERKVREKRKGLQTCSGKECIEKERSVV